MGDNMTLIEQINSDTVNAMKAKEKFSLSVLRMLKSTLQLEAINKKHDLNDDEVIIVIKKQVKVRKDSILEYQKYGKQDLADNLAKEVEILSKYLPEEMSLEDINSEIDKIFFELKPESMKDLGSVMKTASLRLSAKADMKQVSEIIKERLK